VLARRMGEVLQRIAWSVNIRDRLDFSCAVFDASGGLVTNAPHIPVHLGAMGETVRSLKARLGVALRPGRSWAVNDPFAGGSHLPDITVVTPFFVGQEVVAWVASRGHHCDVGGTTPGSMPPFSARLEQEGIVLPDLLVLDEGIFRAEEIQRVLQVGPWPCRDPDTVTGDLEAQVAANFVGVAALKKWVEDDGLASLVAAMKRVQDNGEAVLRTWLDGLEWMERRFEDQLDDGTPVCVQLEILREDGEATRLRVDFDGTGAVSQGNLNAPPPVTRAALLYVLRCAVGRDIPLNEGCLRSVELRLPEGSLLNPPAGSAVVGGNVETSQRIVDVLLGALGLAAASQGTMNNLSFGNERFGYYETLGGGAGATKKSAGRSGVHTHMTNTRITDVEVLESRHPVRVRSFGLRLGSGGGGLHNGGDGLVRAIEFLEPLRVSMLANRRVTQPFGLGGGESGAAGEVWFERSGGRRGRIKEPCFSLDVQSGDVLEIYTPGGGGWGVAAT